MNAIQVELLRRRRGGDEARACRCCARSPASPRRCATPADAAR
jgi:hypothetical protein